jgi:hypothetical protein
MLGDKSKSIEFLKKAMEEHIPNFCRIMSYYDFKDLHSEPGYIELIKKVGLTSYFNNRANDNDPVR